MSYLCIYMYREELKEQEQKPKTRKLPNWSPIQQPQEEEDIDDYDEEEEEEQEDGQHLVNRRLQRHAASSSSAISQVKGRVKEEEADDDDYDEDEVDEGLEAGMDECDEWGMTAADRMKMDGIDPERAKKEAMAKDLLHLYKDFLLATDMVMHIKRRREQIEKERQVQQRYLMKVMDEGNQAKKMLKKWEKEKQQQGQETSGRGVGMEEVVDGRKDEMKQGMVVDEAEYVRELQRKIEVCYVMLSFPSIPLHASFDSFFSVCQLIIVNRRGTKPKRCPKVGAFWNLPYKQLKH